MLVAEWNAGLGSTFLLKPQRGLNGSEGGGEGEDRGGEFNLKELPVTPQSFPETQQSDLV